MSGPNSRRVSRAVRQMTRNDAIATIVTRLHSQSDAFLCELARQLDETPERYAGHAPVLRLFRPDPLPFR